MKVSRQLIGNVPSVIYWPENFDRAKKYPVALFLHGKGEWADNPPKKTDDIALPVYNNGNHANLLKRVDDEKNPFIVVAPHLILSLNGWVPGWTDKYLEPVYDYILDTPTTNLDHIKVVGLSLGGGGVYIASTGKFSQYVSAAIPICGTPQYDCDFSKIKQHSIPVWAFHAKNDTVVSNTHTINQINKINSYKPTPEAKMTLLDSGGHYIWGDVFGRDEVYEWLFSHSKSIAQKPLPETPSQFVPTHIIERVDGSTERVRIEPI